MNFAGIKVEASYGVWSWVILGALVAVLAAWYVFIGRPQFKAIKESDKRLKEFLKKGGV